MEGLKNMPKGKKGPWGWGGFPGAGLGGIGFGGAGYDPIDDSESGTLYDEDFKNTPTEPVAAGAGLGAGLYGAGAGGLGSAGNGLVFGESGKPIDQMTKAEYIQTMKDFYAKSLAQVEDRKRKDQELRDALELLHRWTLSGQHKVMGMQFTLPYNSVRVDLPSFLQDTAVDRWVHTKPDGWTDERLARAKQRFNSMVIDWEWTAEEHAAGGKAAARYCHAENASQHPPAPPAPPGDGCQDCKKTAPPASRGAKSD
jgi:hypothetical protein